MEVLGRAGEDGIDPIVGGADGRRLQVRVCDHGASCPGHENARRNGRSVVVNTDVNTGTATCGLAPLRARRTVSGEAGAWEGGLSTSLRIGCGAGSHRPQPIHRTAPRRRPHSCHASAAPPSSGGQKETPEGTRSLDAPIHVNTDQITRCSCPFRQDLPYPRETPGTIVLSTSFLAGALHFEGLSTGCPQPGDARPQRRRNRNRTRRLSSIGASRTTSKRSDAAARKPSRV